MRMRSSFGHLVLVTALAAAAPLAACGGGEGTSPPAKVPEPTPSTSAPKPVGPTATAPATASVTPPAPHGKPGAMKPPRATAMAEDLKAIGLDPKNLPALDKMEPEKLRKVMNLFKKALGTDCGGCHNRDDFRAPTPHKKLASRMWKEFVRGMTLEDGSPLFCDSCHDGHMEFLERTDKKALSQWMDTNYVSKLRRADKKEHGCETCHGDPFEPRFLANWEK